jgi:hypothetical protein
MAAGHRSWRGWIGYIWNTVPQRKEQSFQLDPCEVASARRFVAGVMREWGICADDVILVVGELAANAVLHARTGFTVRLCLEPARLMVEVADQNPELPAMVPCPQERSAAGA